MAWEVPDSIRYFCSLCWSNPSNKTPGHYTMEGCSWRGRFLGSLHLVALPPAGLLLSPGVDRGSLISAHASPFAVGQSLEIIQSQHNQRP